MFCLVSSYKEYKYDPQCEHGPVPPSLHEGYLCGITDQNKHSVCLIAHLSSLKTLHLILLWSPLGIDQTVEQGNALHYSPATELQLSRLNSVCMACEFSSNTGGDDLHA